MSAVPATSFGREVTRTDIFSPPTMRYFAVPFSKQNGTHTALAPQSPRTTPLASPGNPNLHCFSSAITGATPTTQDRGLCRTTIIQENMLDSQKGISTSKSGQEAHNRTQTSRATTLRQALESSNKLRYYFICVAVTLSHMAVYMYCGATFPG